MLPKAGLARLAKDAGGRLAPGDHDRLQRELFVFLAAVLRHARRALTFTRRKSLARGHVEFAIGAVGKPLLAKTARSLKDKDLDRLHRCNIYAAPTVRRSPIGAVEISEATFARVLRTLARAEGLQGRFGAKARRLLHLCSENFLVAAMAPDPQVDEPSATPLFVSRVLADAMEVTPNDGSVAARLGSLFETVASRLDPLLKAKNTKTINTELLVAALAEADPLIDFCDDAAPSTKGLRVVENLLRGRAPDRWVTSGAIHTLTTAITRLATASEIK